MKTIICIFIFTIFFCSASQSQNITNIIGTNGWFTIRNGSNTYFSLSQSSGNVNLSNSIILQNTSSLSTGVIYKGSNSFLHNYGSANTFLGVAAGNFTMTGGNNTAIGFNTFSSNTSGQQNTAFGNGSLRYNSTGYDNTAIGVVSLFYNTTGSQNTTIGSYSLYRNTIGNLNTSLGGQSLFSNTTGNMNTALGYKALYSLTTGNSNIAIGNNAQVPSSTSNGQVRIGDIFIGYAGIQVAWSITSDRRWKENILPSNLGLSFLSKLNPVSYTRINDESQKTEYGLIAQELEEVLNEEGIKNTGMITKTDEGFYELRYNDLLAPMIKAIQELKAENDELRSRLNVAEVSNQKIAKLEAMYSELYKTISNMKSNMSETVNVSENK